MRIVYMGTPQLAATVLEALAEQHEIVQVVTRPDAVRGRGNKTAASPVKASAMKLGIPVHECTSMKDADSRYLMESLAPDAICVAACGIILPRDILEIPRYGCFNVHTSLLPRWRGAAPIERSILQGDEITGVCIMRMDEGLDTGPYCRRAEVAIAGRYLDELTEELAHMGSEELLAALECAQDGTIEWVDQGEEGLTYAEKIGKGELALEIDDTAETIVAKVRASSSAHPARAEVAGKTLAVERAAVAVDETSAALCEGLVPGCAKYASKRLFIGASEGIVELLQVRPDGKKSMDARSFAGGIQGIKNIELTWGRA